MLKLIMFLLYFAFTIMCFKRINMDFIDTLLFMGATLSATFYAVLEWDDKLL